MIFFVRPFCPFFGINQWEQNKTLLWWSCIGPFIYVKCSSLKPIAIWKKQLLHMLSVKTQIRPFASNFILFTRLCCFISAALVSMRSSSFSITYFAAHIHFFFRTPLTKRDVLRTFSFILVKIAWLLDLLRPLQIRQNKLQFINLIDASY